MSDILLPEDDLPKDGTWVDIDEVIASPTFEEVIEGNRQGLAIDTGDDSDSGLVRTVFTRSVSQYESARNKAQDLKRVMLEYGVPEVSIELVDGRPNSYGTWDALFVVTNFSHHTVSRYASSSLTPVLSLVKNGRSDLPGPLANGYGGWDLCYRIITFGYANHPGYGGPITVPALTAGSFTIPKDSARRYAWGTEWEGGLNAADWDKVLTNPRNGKRMTFREFMGRAHAALQEYHKVHPRAHLEHSTWTDRKVDRLGYDREKGIAEIDKYRNPNKTSGDEFDMASREEVQRWVADTPIALVVDGKETTWSLERVLKFLYRTNTAINGKLNALPDQNALVSAIVSALPATGGAGEGLAFTEEELRQAVEAGVRNVLGSLDNP